MPLVRRPSRALRTPLTLLREGSAAIVIAGPGNAPPAARLSRSSCAACHDINPAAAAAGSSRAIYS
jgi:mono/diheme cytochrome c family protein